MLFVLVVVAGVFSLKKNSGNAEFERRRREDRGAWGVGKFFDFGS